MTFSCRPLRPRTTGARIWTLVPSGRVVVDLRHGAHGRPGIAVGRLLVDGDGGGQALDVLHIRLFHLAQELSGVGGQGLHVAPLTFRIDGIKSEGRFARARQTGQDDQLVAGDGHIDPFEVMFIGAPDLNAVVRVDLSAALRVDLLLSQGLFLIFRQGRPVVRPAHFYRGLLPGSFSRYFCSSHI